MEERGGLTGCGEGVEGLWAGEGEVRGSPGEREGAEGVSGAGRGAEAEGGEEGLGVGVGLVAAGLVAAGLGLMVAEAAIALPGLGAVGGPRGFGDTGGGTRFGSGQTESENDVSLLPTTTVQSSHIHKTCRGWMLNTRADIHSPGEDHLWSKRHQ